MKAQTTGQIEGNLKSLGYSGALVKEERIFWGRKEGV